MASVRVISVSAGGVGQGGRNFHLNVNFQNADQILPPPLAKKDAGQGGPAPLAPPAGGASRNTDPAHDEQILLPQSRRFRKMLPPHICH